MGIVTWGIMKFCTVSILSFMAAAALPGHVQVTAEGVVPNPQQTEFTERPCEAECVMKQRCEEVCVDADSCDGIDCVPICEEVCTDPYEECTFQVGRDEISSELGYLPSKEKVMSIVAKGRRIPYLVSRRVPRTSSLNDEQGIITIHWDLPTVRMVPWMINRNWNQVSVL